MREAEEQQPQPFGSWSRPRRSKLPFVASDDDDRERDRRHEEDHAHHGTDGRRHVAGILPRMYELRSSSEGTVVRVEVDEGQMVAEDDEIAVLDDGGRDASWSSPTCRVSCASSTSRPATRVTPGTVVALIDES